MKKNIKKEGFSPSKKTVHTLLIYGDLKV